MHPRVHRDGAAAGRLFGQVVVFTAALHIPREEAADLAAAAGCDVAASVSKKTTIPVVGDQDGRLLKGHERSTKQRKAEELIAGGSAIRIIGEADFRSMSWAKD